MTLFPNPLVAAPRLLSAARPLTKTGRALHFPLIRIPLLLLALAPVGALNFGLSVLVLDRLPEPIASNQLGIQALFLLPLLIWAYSTFCRKVEGREAWEFSSRGAFWEFLAGASISASWIGGLVGVLALAGCYRVVETQGTLTLFNSFFLFGLGSFAQELLFSLVLFRLLEDWLGSWRALLVSALVFAAAHAFNPGTSALSILDLFVGGASYLAAFIYSRRMWLVWGLHFSWNFFQAGVFGMPNSGIAFKGLVKPAISGPAWLTGGAFGIEASVLTLTFSVCLAALLLTLSSRHAQILAARWRR